MHETIVSTNIPRIRTKSQRDHECGERAPPQNGGGARIYGENGRF